jgi:23S rRNA (uracil1939-C5)-methyltransferase
VKETKRLRVDRFVYGGYGLAHAEDGAHGTVLVPFALPGEVIDVYDDAGELRVARIAEPSPERVQPGCPHFGVCGGCHLQMAGYEEQLRLKRDVLHDALQRAGVMDIPEIAPHASEPWGYRNRIRLHVARDGSALRLGYRERKSHQVLPIVTCSIAAPILWSTAERLLGLADRDSDTRRWLEAAREVELFCDDRMERVQMMLLCETDLPSLPRGSFERVMTALHTEMPAFAGVGAVKVHPRTGQVQREIVSWGAAGLSYTVAEERYWIARGGFFQVNRFLLPAMVELVCKGRSGSLAWDLFAGAGLFARFLTRSFERMTAVEANAEAARELASALQRAGAHHTAMNTTTLEFLRRAVLERDRPDLVVLDPPRAGAGAEVCGLLAKIAPAEIVYVSCDPVTLARDLAMLQTSYVIENLHLVDLFPQTYHQEAVVVLRRRP